MTLMSDLRASPMLKRAANPVVLLCLLCIAATWALAFHQIETARSSHRRAMADRTGDHAIAYERNVADVINELDTVLKTLRTMHEQLVPQVSWRMLLASQYANNRVAAQFAVIDARGILVASTSPLPAEPVDLSYREHFRVHVDAVADDLFVSQPVIGRVSGQRTIQLTRRVSQADGSFGGVIVATVDPERLTGSYRNITLGKKGGVALIGDDGIVRAGTGVFAAAPETPAWMSEKVKAAVAAARTERGDAHVVDDGAQLIASRRVGQLPLTVAAALDEEIAKSPWNANVRNYVGLAFACTVMLVVAFMFAMRLQLLAIASIKQRNAMAVEKRVAEAATADRTLFLAVMSHEIRTPLNGMLGALDLVRSEPLSPLGRKHVNMATECGEMLLKVIGDILLFSKLEHDAIELDAQPLLLRDLLIGTVEAMQPLANKAGNTLQAFVSDEADELVVGDCNRLRQVLVNLIGNAIKFTQDGRIDLTVDTISSDAETLTVRICLTDTGIGIPADKQRLIFDRFRTLDATYTRRTEGTGLGLAISDKIVRAMGSRIELESQVGRGSCFSFVISFRRAERPQYLQLVPQSPRPVASAARKLRILLAEDNPTNAYVVTQILVEAGHVVRPAATGRDALALAEAEPFDLILMDISMPEMDGIEATRLIRERAGMNSATHVIALTAHVVDGSGKEFACGKFDGLLTKPIRKSALIEALAAVGAHPAVRNVQPAFAVETEPAVEADGDVELVDVDTFAEFVRERSPSRLLRSLAIFVEELGDKLRQLDKLMQQSDRNALRMLAHSGVGSGGMVGASQFVRLSREVERLCAQEAPVDHQLLDDLRRAIVMTIRVFSAMTSTEAVRSFLQQHHSLNQASISCRL